MIRTRALPDTIRIRPNQDDLYLHPDPNTKQLLEKIDWKEYREHESANIKGASIVLVLLTVIVVTCIYYSVAPEGSKNNHTPIKEVTLHMG